MTSGASVKSTGARSEQTYGRDETRRKWTVFETIMVEGRIYPARIERDFTRGYQIDDFHTRPYNESAEARGLPTVAGPSDRLEAARALNYAADLRVFFWPSTLLRPPATARWSLRNVTSATPDYRRLRTTALRWLCIVRSTLPSVCWYWLVFWLAY